MKKLILLLTVISISGVVYAENAFDYNNPFLQKNPQSMNNIYESKPDTMQREQKKVKKLWFGRDKKTQQELPSDYVVPQSKVINEGVNDGSYYVFK